MIIPPELSIPASLTRRLALAAATIALAAAPAVAGPGANRQGACGAAGTAQLTVTGEGQAGVAPDMAQVTLGVTTQAPTAAQAMADNGTRQAAVLAALTAQGVAERDVQTSGLNLSPMQDYSREGQPPVITGYQAQNMVTVRVRDLARLGAVLDGLVTAGANEVQGIAFSREDRTATEDQARTQAVGDARHRAEVLARAAGLQLGRLIALGDAGATRGPMPAMMMARDAKAESVPIATGEMTVTAQVSATWELLPQAGAADCPMPGGPQGMSPGGPMHGGPMQGHGHGHGMMHDAMRGHGEGHGHGHEMMDGQGPAHGHHAGHGSGMQGGDMHHGGGTNHDGMMHGGGMMHEGGMMPGAGMIHGPGAMAGPGAASPTAPADAAEDASPSQTILPPAPTLDGPAGVGSDAPAPAQAPATAVQPSPGQDTGPTTTPPQGAVAQPATPGVTTAESADPPADADQNSGGAAAAPAAPTN